jgi:hypothetical protein
VHIGAMTTGSSGNERVVNFGPAPAGPFHVVSIVGQPRRGRHTRYTLVCRSMKYWPISMPILSPTERRTLRLLARNRAGYAQAQLMAHGVPGDVLDALVLEELATARPSVICVDGLEKTVVWIQITRAGVEAIAE